MVIFNGPLCMVNVISSQGDSSASPSTSKPHTMLAIVAGHRTVAFVFMGRYLYDALMMSEKIPAAVTSAPAPAPLMTNG